MKILELLRKIREAQDITQRELAEKIGISQSAIAQFEKKKATLSTQTLLDIASVLNISPDYLTGKTQNPFKSDNIIRFYLLGNNLRVDLHFLWFLIGLGFLKEIQFCIYPAVKKLKRISAETPVQAILASDVNNNLFLITAKKPTALIADLPMLETRTKEALQEGNRYPYFPNYPFLSKTTISLDLIERIKKNKVTRNDFEMFLLAPPKPIYGRQELCKDVGYGTEWPIKDVLKDTLKYLKYYPDPLMKEDIIREIVEFYNISLLKDFDKSRLEKDLKRALENFHITSAENKSDNF